MGDATITRSFRSTKREVEKIPRPLQFVRATLILIGASFASVTIFSERLGIGAPGLGSEQVQAISTALLMLVLGLVLCFQSFALWVAKHGHFLIVILFWLCLLIPPILAVELYVRSRLGYFLLSWSLSKNPFFELDRLKVWNRSFYLTNKRHFREWPIRLEFFDSNKPQPPYLFKPNQRMARHGSKLVPAASHEALYRSTNSWGFRGPEFSIAKPAHTLRIVCLGASTTEGSQSDRETYPRYLQQELSRLFPDQRIEILNAGHHAYKIDDFLEVLKQRILPLQPDVVIFYEAINNIIFPEYLRNYQSPWQTCQLNSYPSWYRRLYTHSAIFSMFSERLGLNRRKPFPMPHEFNNFSTASATHYKNSLRQMAQEVLKHNTSFVLTSFVTLAHEGLEVSYGENPRVFKELYQVPCPLTAGEIGRIYSHFNQQSREVAQEFNLPYADLAKDFPREVRYFPFDLVHFSPEGNQILAALLAQFLAKEVIPEILTKRRANRGDAQGE